MDDSKKFSVANIVRYFSRIALLALSILVFTFALLSGSEGFGGGLGGVIKNSPNALPWLVLLAFNYVAWKWELIGGIIITLLGFGMLYFFNFHGNNFFVSTFVLTLLIIALGVLFIISWYLRKDNK